jgi:hypothetical protein
MLGDSRTKGRDLGDLMATRLGIEAVEILTAFATGFGKVIDDGIESLGRDHDALMATMPGLSATPLARGLTRRRPLDARRIGGRRPRGVSGVEVEACLEVGDASLEGQILLHQREDQGLKLRGSSIPEPFRDDRRPFHARAA